MQAAYRGTTIGHLIEEGLEAKEELARQTLLRLLEQSRERSESLNMSDDEIMEIAVREVRAIRDEKVRERAAADNHR